MVLDFGHETEEEKAVKAQKEIETKKREEIKQRQGGNKMLAYMLEIDWRLNDPRNANHFK